MEPCSLHLVSEQDAVNYIGALPLSDSLTDRDLLQVGAGFARFLADRGTSFAAEGLSLTSWEARVDRGLSMFLRPPSRLFLEAGLPTNIARRLPIRLELQEGVMGGCYLPARLISDAADLIDRNLERSVRRMLDAEMNAPVLQGLMFEAILTARDRHQGLFEAIGVVVADVPQSWPRSQHVVVRPTDRELEKRIALAIRPEQEAGILKRFLGRLSN